MFSFWDVHASTSKACFVLSNDRLPFTNKCSLYSFQPPAMAHFINFIFSLVLIFWMGSPQHGWQDLPCCCQTTVLRFYSAILASDHHSYIRSLVNLWVTALPQFYSIGPSVSLLSVLHVLLTFMCLNVTLCAVEVLQNSMLVLRTLMCLLVKQRTVELPQDSTNFAHTLFLWTWRCVLLDINLRSAYIMQFPIFVFVFVVDAESCLWVQKLLQINTSVGRLYCVFFCWDCRRDEVRFGKPS